jgi:nitrogen PTS system EIIA component
MFAVKPALSYFPENILLFLKLFQENILIEAFGFNMLYVSYSTEVLHMSSMIDYTNEKFIKRIKTKNKYKAIEELASVFSKSGICDDISILKKALKEREDIMSTGIGLGMAIPHAKIKNVSKLSFAIGISKKGIEFDSIDDKPVHLIVLVAAGEDQHKDYLKLLSHIMAVLKDDKIRNKIINSTTNHEVFEAFKQ